MRKYIPQLISVALIFFGYGILMGGSHSGNRPMEIAGGVMLAIGCLYLIYKLVRNIK